MTRKSGLWQALDFNLSEVLRSDFFLGLAGGLGAGLLGVYAPNALLQAVPTVSAFVGVVVGAVIAGAAILAAFLDQPFLRKLRAINKGPIRYLAPFLFTATLGVFAALFLIALSAMNSESAVALLTIVGGLAGFLAFWTVGSLLQCLSVLVQFIQLKEDAIDVPDDIDIKPSSGAPSVRRVGEN